MQPEYDQPYSLGFIDGDKISAVEAARILLRTTEIVPEEGCKALINWPTIQLLWKVCSAFIMLAESVERHNETVANLQGKVEKLRALLKEYKPKDS